MRKTERTGAVGNRNEHRGSAASGSSGTPLGVTIIAILGIIGSVLTLALSPTLLQYGAIGVVLALVLGGLAVAEIYVMVGLLAMKRWAYTWALVLEGFGVFVDLLRVNVVGVLIGLLVVGYLMSKSDRFR